MEEHYYAVNCTQRDMNQNSDDVERHKRKQPYGEPHFSETMLSEYLTESKSDSPEKHKRQYNIRGNLYKR